MHRIDTPTALPDKFGQGKNGFTRGNPQAGQQATALDDDYCDSLQEEICAVIESAGIQLNKENRHQLLSALNQKFASVAELNGKANLTQAFLLKGSLGTHDLNNVIGTDYQGIWWQSATANATAARNYPIVSAGNLLVIYNSVASYGITQIYITHVSKRIFIRSKATSTDAWEVWSEVWTSANLANPATIDTAQNITGLKQYRRDSEAFMIFPVSQGKSSFIRGNEADGSARWYLGYGGDDVNTLTLHNYKADSGIYFNDNGDISINPAAGKGIYQWQYPLLADGSNAAADTHGFWRKPGSAELTPSLIGALSVNELAGIPQPFPGATAPTGWLKCNGQQFNTAQYPVLASRYPSGFLPDLRGEFVRGWDDGRGVDSGRELLSLQSQSIQSHAHSGGITGPAAGLIDGYGSGAPGVDNYNMGQTESTGGTETRPRNIAFNYIVRAA